MAIDSAEKRRSLSGIQSTLIAGVTPNSTQDIEWRQESGWSYPGITVAAVAAWIAGQVHSVIADLAEYTAAAVNITYSALEVSTDYEADPVI